MARSHVAFYSRSSNVGKPGVGGCFDPRSSAPPQLCSRRRRHLSALSACALALTLAVGLPTVPGTPPPIPIHLRAARAPPSDSQAPAHTHAVSSLAARVPKFTERLGGHVSVVRAGGPRQPRRVGQVRLRVGEHVLGIDERALAMRGVDAAVQPQPAA